MAVAAAVNVFDATARAYIGNGAVVNADSSQANAAQQVRVAAGTDMFFTAVTLSVFLALLWPSRSAEAFHANDSSLLGEDAGGALDEAYSYAAVLQQSEADAGGAFRGGSGAI